MDKTCPIYSEYDGDWYIYEDLGVLTPKWLSSSPAKQEPKQATDNSSENKMSEFTQLYMSLRQHLEQTYKLSQQLESYNWRQFAGLSWTIKDDNGVDEPFVLDDMLPSAEMEESLLAQCDKSNALAVKLWTEELHKKPSKQGDGHLTRAQWQVQQQLVIELGKAKSQAVELRSVTDNKFADADKKLNLSDSSYKRITLLFQSNHAKYTTILDELLKGLEQAEQLTLKLNPLRIDPNALNLP